MKLGDDPPYLMVGTEVSAKYKGAFCEAKIRKVVRVVKCRVTYKSGLGSATISDDLIKGDLRVGNVVEAKHADKNQFVEATINKIQDSSQYTVVFDDGDITTLRRSALCLKSGRHFNESETLDQLPLTHPEHFSNPVMGGRRGVRRRAANNDDNENESSEEEDIPVKKGRKKVTKEADMGKVVCVDSTDKKKLKDAWFPALIVSPSAQDTVKIRTKDEYLVRSFKDGRYYTVPKKETTDFTKDSLTKAEHSSNKVSAAACEKAVQYLEKNELPAHWDRDVLFGHLNHENSDDGVSESELSEDDPREEKDRFVAQLYKFMDERGTPINKAPVVCSKDVDLYKLYKIVTSKGGYNRVTNSSQWKPVTIKMGYGAVPTTSTINLVKQAYKKYLHSFEELYKKLGCPLNSIGSVPTSGKSRSSRSIFRDRYTAVSVKEAKKEEAKLEKEETEKKPTPPTASSSSSVTSPIEEAEVDSDSEESKKAESSSDRPDQETRRSRSRQDSRIQKKDSDETSEKAAKGKRMSKKRETSEQKDRDQEREDSRTPVSASPSPAPPSSASGKRGRGKYKKKESPVGDAAPKAEHEDSPDHIGKNVKIQIGDKLQVYYGPKSKGNVTYEAKVLEIELEQRYLVHYTGWNTRYDEWIERFRIASLCPQKDQGRGSELAPEPENISTTPPPKPSTTKTPKRKGRPASVTPNQSAKVKATAGRKNQLDSEKGKTRRTRQKSGQDSITQSGSESDRESSDSEDKQLQIISTPSSVSSSASSARISKNKKLKVNEDDDASSVSSTTSGITPKAKPEAIKDVADGAAATATSVAANSGGSSGQPAEKQNQVIDLNQIRSEMKGLDKMVKESSTPSSTVSRTNAPSPVISVPAASMCLPQNEIKLDVYEFQEDDAPKLKMFAPRSPDKKEEQLTKIISETLDKGFSKSSSIETIEKQLESGLATLSTTPPSVTSPPQPELPLKSISTTPQVAKEELVKMTKDTKKKKEVPKPPEELSGPKTAKPSISLLSKPVFTASVTTSGNMPSSSSSVSTPQPIKPTVAPPVPILQACTAVETNPRMIPILQVPQHPPRQRAVVTSFPPPLIPSGTTKPIPVAPVPVRPSPSGLQMPSLTQRPHIPIHTNAGGLFTSSSQQNVSQVPHIRIVPSTPTSSLATPISTNIPHVTITPAPSLQPAAIIKASDMKSVSFASRQQEVFPHLIQQAKTSSPMFKPVTVTGPGSGGTSMIGNPVAVITANRSAIIPTSQMLPVAAIISKDHTSVVPLSSTSTLSMSSPFMSGPAKESLLNRKPSPKEKSSAQQLAKTLLGTPLTTISGPLLTPPKVDPAQVPPKKKAKKVVTKNIMNLSSGDSKTNELSPVKKARKPAKKKLLPGEQETPPGIIEGHKLGKPSPAKKKLNKTEVSRPEPMMIQKGKPLTSGLQQPPPPTYLHPLPLPTSFSIPVSAAVPPPQVIREYTPLPPTASGTRINVPEMVSSSSVFEPNKPVTSFSARTSEMFAGHPGKIDSKSCFKPLPPGPMGVLRTPEKKSYAPKMSLSAAAVARMTSCIDSVAKLPATEAAPAPIPKIVTTVMNTTPFKPLPASTTYVKIPGKYDASPIVITTMAPGQPAITSKPITVIPTMMRSTVPSPCIVPGSNNFTSPPVILPSTVSVPVTVTVASKVSSVSSSVSFSNDAITQSGMSQNNAKLVVAVPVPKDSQKLSLLASVSSYPSSALPSSTVVLKADIKPEKMNLPTAEIKTEAQSSELVVLPPEKVVSIGPLKLEPLVQVKQEEKPKDLSLSAIPASAGENVIKEEVKEEEESCNSLLCEEIIPGSPPPGADSSLFGIEEEVACKRAPTTPAKESPVIKQGYDHTPSSISSGSVPPKTMYTGKFDSPSHLPPKPVNVSERVAEPVLPSKIPRTLEPGFKDPPTLKESSVEHKGEDSLPSTTKSQVSHKSSLSASTYRLPDSAPSATSKPPAAKIPAHSSVPMLPERPSGNPVNAPQVPVGFNNAQQNLQHVMDNTPPTTPESSSVSSGSPRVEGGRVSPTHDAPSSSKSKDSSDLDSNDHKMAETTEEGSSSDAGRKYKEPSASPQKKKQVESTRNSRATSPPSKRRRVQRRMKSPEEVVRNFTSRGRGSAGRKAANVEKEVEKLPPPPPPINLVKPPVSSKYNFIPELDDEMESEIRIQVLQQALQNIKEKYQEVKSELSSEERRLKRYKRRQKEREKEKSRLSQKSS